MDDIERVILLQDLRRFLMNRKYPELHLQNLPKLRAEVEMEYQKLAKEKEKVTS